MPESCSRVRWLPYVMSHWLFALVSLIIFIICINTVTGGDAGPFKSAEVKDPFTTDPVYFVQLSDTHFTGIYPERTENETSLMANVRNTIDPRITVITGDITDGSNTTTTFARRQQYKEAWDIYNDTIHISGLVNSNSDVIAIPGNHDCFNIESYDSPSNYMRYYSTQPDPNETVNAYDYHLGDHDVRFVTLNPVRFPYLSAPVGMMPYCAREIMDELELAFREGAVNILLSHYPRSVLWSGRSSSGKTLSEIFNKAELFLNGHLHPRSAEIFHVDNLVAVTCPPTHRSNQIGLISIERAGIVYHRINPWQKDIIAVTYPVPLEQASPNQVFSQKSFPVRVLSFTEEPLSLELFIDGKSFGKFANPRKLADAKSTWFYTLEVHDIEEGTHKLGIAGAEFEEYEFYVGQETPTIAQPSAGIFTPTFFFVMMPFMMLQCLVRVIPWWIPIQKLMDEYEAYMHGRDGDIQWYRQLYLGPLYHWSRFRKIPKSLHICFTVAVVWFYVVPFYFAKSESTVAAVWSWGYAAAGETYHFNITFWITFLYYWAIFIPLANICGNFYEAEGALVICQIVEIVLNSLCLAFMWVALVVILRLAGEVFTVFTSPALYSLTFFIIYTFYVSIRDFYAKKTTTVENGVAEQHDEDEKEDRQDITL